MIHRCAHRLRIALLSCCALVSHLSIQAAAHGGSLILYVDDNAPLGGDGDTWTSPYRFLQTALAVASSLGIDPTEIHIAGGTYKPDQTEATPDGSGARTASFPLVNNVVLRGGYLGLDAGPGEDPDTQDIAAHETILSGDLSGDDLPGFVNTAENSIHVVRGLQVRKTALEGLTITGGRADGPESGGENRGGGARIVGADNSFWFKVVEITNCTFRQNFATYGGGIDTHNLDLFEISQCTFSENGTDGIGSALSAYGTEAAFIDHSAIVNNHGSALAGVGTSTISDCSFDGNSSPEGSGAAVSGGVGQLVHCTFHGNSAAVGGAVSFYEDADISDCTFDSNSAERGGAIYVQEGSGSIQNCTFINNSAEEGGAIAMYAFGPAIEGGYFESNAATQDGGAILISGIFDGKDFEPSAPMLTSCTFVGNTAKIGGAIASHSAEPKIVNGWFESNSATLRGGGLASIGAVHGGEYGPSHLLSRPRMYNCVFLDNSSAKGGALYGTVGLATLVNCTVTQNAATLGGAVHSQSSGGVRVYNSIVRNNAGGSFSGPGPRVVRYSNIRGGHVGIGNINLNPRFVNSARGDLRLRAGSPCIDSGRNAYLLGSIVVDIAGKPRIHDDPATADTGVGSPYVLDMGAYEF